MLLYVHTIFYSFFELQRLFIEDLSPFFQSTIYILFYYKFFFAINEIPRIILKNSSGNTYPHVTYPTHSFHSSYISYFFVFMMNSCSPPTQLIDRLVVVRFKIIKFNWKLWHFLIYFLLSIKLLVSIHPIYVSTCRHEVVASTEERRV